MPLKSERLHPISSTSARFAGGGAMNAVAVCSALGFSLLTMIRIFAPFLAATLARRFGLSSEVNHNGTSLP
jgi:hypothetical protein